MSQKISQVKGIAVFMTLMASGLLLQSNTSQATTYTVGDSKGWVFNVAGWENGKSFKAGDILIFKYNPAFHNVVAVDKSSYDSCSVPANAKPIYSSGNDQLTLKQGPNYFVCGRPGHCDSGMKIAANAA